MQRWLGRGFRFYRLFFNAFSLATLLPLLAYDVWRPDESIFRWAGPWVILQYGLLWLGVYLLVAGGRHYSLAQFLGLHQIRTGRMEPTLTGEGGLDFSGIHGVIRHPWYAAGILMVWTRDISWSRLLTNIVIDVYFVVGAVLEERKLLKTFGTQYASYQKQVSMLFPYKYLKAKMSRS